MCFNFLLNCGFEDLRFEDLRRRLFIKNTFTWDVDGFHFQNGSQCLKQHLGPPSSHLPNSLVIEDTVVTGNERIAELFNQHFVKCGNLFDSITPPKPPTNTPPPSPSSAAPCHSFGLQKVSENDVLEVLSKLDPNKPAGLDGLDPFFF